MCNRASHFFSFSYMAVGSRGRGHSHTLLMSTFGSGAVILYFSAINKKRLHSINAAHLTFTANPYREITGQNQYTGRSLQSLQGISLQSTAFFCFGYIFFPCFNNIEIVALVPVMCTGNCQFILQGLKCCFNPIPNRLGHVTYNERADSALTWYEQG